MTMPQRSCILSLKGDTMARRRGQQNPSPQRDGVWWILRFYEDRIDAKGNVKRARPSTILGPCKGVNALTEKEAKRKAREFLELLDIHTTHPKSMATLEQFCEQRFVPDVVWTMKHAGKLHYQYCLRKILPALGKRPLRDVTPVEVQALVKMMVEHGYSSQTVAHIRNAVSAIFTHAKRIGHYGAENPASLVRLPEMVRKERKALSFQRATQVLEALASPVREMAFLSMTTSLNIAEMCGLRWKRVNLSDQYVLVDGETLQPWSIKVCENYYRNRYGSTKTGRRLRVVPIPERAISMLQELKRRTRFHLPDDPVFSGRTGRPVDAHNTNSRVLSKLGVSWHVFRHTCATFSEQIGMARADRIALMGHAGGVLTDRYTHSDIERRRAGVNEIASRILGPTGVVQ